MSRPSDDFIDAPLEWLAAARERFDLRAGHLGTEEELTRLWATWETVQAKVKRAMALLEHDPHAQQKETWDATLSAMLSDRDESLNPKCGGCPFFKGGWRGMCSRFGGLFHESLYDERWSHRCLALGGPPSGEP